MADIQTAALLRKSRGACDQAPRVIIYIP
jgi:hypothetical protein